MLPCDVMEWLNLYKEGQIIPEKKDDVVKEMCRVRYITDEKELENTINSDLRLIEAGFTFDGESSTLYYAFGSIANYIKMWVYSPRKMTSVATGKDVLAYPVKIEKFAEAGYLETDFSTIKECNIVVGKLDVILSEIYARSGKHAKD